MILNQNLLSKEQQIRYPSNDQAEIEDAEGIRPGAISNFDEDDSISKTQRMRNAAAILHECDLAAEAFARKSDSAETIRRLREETHRQICKNES